MEEKERFEVNSPTTKSNGCAYILDIKTDNILNTYDSCNLLNQQYKKIKELEEENTYFRKEMLRDGETFTLSQAKVIDEINKENQQLKQQLHDLPKQIVEEIIEELCNCGKTYLEDEPYIEICIVKGILDTILKKYGGGNE